MAKDVRSEGVRSRKMLLSHRTVLASVPGPFLSMPYSEQYWLLTYRVEHPTRIGVYLQSVSMASAGCGCPAGNGRPIDEKNAFASDGDPKYATSPLDKSITLSSRLSTRGLGWCRLQSTVVPPLATFRRSVMTRSAVAASAYRNVPVFLLSIGSVG